MNKKKFLKKSRLLLKIEFKKKKSEKKSRLKASLKIPFYSKFLKSRFPFFGNPV